VAIPRCTARTTAGKRCRITTNLHNGRCLWHDKSRQAEAAEARQRGGQARKKPPVDPALLPAPPNSVAEARGYLAAVAGLALSGAVPAAAARAAVAALRVWTDAERFAARIAALEEAVARLLAAGSAGRRAVGGG
jgi:hypothetical protein